MTPEWLLLARRAIMKVPGVEGFGITDQGPTVFLPRPSRHVERAVVEALESAKIQMRVAFDYTGGPARAGG